MSDLKKIHVNDGRAPLQKGYTPKKVQGGYVPTSATTTGGKPPSGGSGAKAPKM